MKVLETYRILCMDSLETIWTLLEVIVNSMKVNSMKDRTVDLKDVTQTHTQTHALSCAMRH